MFSTSPGPEAVMANKMLGAQRLIVKPANFNNLVAVLSGIVRSPLTFFFLFFIPDHLHNQSVCSNGAFC